MRLNHRLVVGVVAVLVTAGLLGCTTDGQTNRTRTGALTGGVLGAGAGALIDKDEPLRGALIGAAAGSAIGAGIGHVLQRQKVAFEKIEGLETEQQTVLIQQPTQPAPPATTAPGETAPPASAPTQVERPALMVRTQGEVFFAQGSWALTPSGQTKMREIAEILQQYPDSDVYIRGFASPEGSTEANRQLSERRADAVRNELLSYGIAPDRLHVFAMGETSPVVTGSEADLTMSRRVEIIIVPRGQTGTGEMQP
jgi:outer membrane protein OmpA-like peptidoglycan-associated protein